MRKAELLQCPFPFRRGLRIRGSTKHDVVTCGIAGLVKGRLGLRLGLWKQATAAEGDAIFAGDSVETGPDLEQRSVASLPWKEASHQWSFYSYLQQGSTSTR